MVLVNGRQSLYATAIIAHKSLCKIQTLASNHCKLVCLQTSTRGPRCEPGKQQFLEKLGQASGLEQMGFAHIPFDARPALEASDVGEYACNASAAMSPHRLETRPNYVLSKGSAAFAGHG